MTIAIECSGRKSDDKHCGADWIHNTVAYWKKAFKFSGTVREPKKPLVLP